MFGPASILSLPQHGLPTGSWTPIKRLEVSCTIHYTIGRYILLFDYPRNVTLDSLLSYLVSRQPNHLSRRILVRRSTQETTRYLSYFFRIVMLTHISVFDKDYRTLSTRFLPFPWYWWRPSNPAGLGNVLFGIRRRTCTYGQRVPSCLHFLASLIYIALTNGKTSFMNEGTAYLKVFKLNEGTNKFKKIGNDVHSGFVVEPSLTESNGKVYVSYTDFQEGDKVFVKKYENNTWKNIDGINLSASTSGTRLPVAPSMLKYSEPPNSGRVSPIT